MTPLTLILWVSAWLLAEPAQPLRTDCDAGAPEIARVTPTSELRVVSAITGENKPAMRSFSGETEQKSADTSRATICPPWKLLFAKEKSRRGRV